MRRNRISNLIAGQGLPFETLGIESCLTAVVVVTGGLAVGHGVFERDPGDLENAGHLGPQRHRTGLRQLPIHQPGAQLPYTGIPEDVPSSFSMAILSGVNIVR